MRLVSKDREFEMNLMILIRWSWDTVTTEAPDFAAHIVGVFL